MADIEWVGFDMDYTLAVYDRAAMDALVIGVTIERLIARGYPAEIEQLEADTTFPIRGLVIDKRHGHVLKLDRYRLVQKGYHGMHALSREDIRARYQSRRIRLASQRYHWVDTLYGLSETALYARLVQWFEEKGTPVDYTKLFDDIRQSADEAYSDGTVPTRILEELGKYVRRDALIAPTLHKLRSAGKRLFLLTNSPWTYTNPVMERLLGGAMPEYPTWRHYFDVVITSAAKPSFFQDRKPLLERDVDSSRRGNGGLRPAGQVERGRVYEGGNLADLERMLGVTGDRILYVGDHIYGDILRSKKEASWRTALIIEELTSEIAAHDKSAHDFDRLHDLNAQRNELEDELRANQTLFKDLSRQIEATKATKDTAMAAALDVNRQRLKRAVERVRGLLRQVDAETAQLDGRTERRFHPYWGPLLKEGTELSSFGDQVQAYACVYTARVSSFLSYSPIQFFRSPRDVMAHEM